MRKITFALLALLLVTAIGCNPRGRRPGPDIDPKATQVGDVSITRDIVYRTVDGEELALDVYRPDGGRDLPGLLLIHGGGWATGTKDASTAGGVRLAQQGFVVFALDYRLAPPGGEWHAPAQIEDCRAALLWIRENGDSYGTDTQRIAAFGPSAGGNLALLLGTTGTRGRDKADVVASFSGPTDLTDADAPMFQRQEELLVNYLGCPVGECEELAREMSPLTHAGRGDAPTFLANSESEMVPVQQAVALADALEDAGVTVELARRPGVAHGVGLTPTMGARALAFLRKHLR